MHVGLFKPCKISNKLNGFRGEQFEILLKLYRTLVAILVFSLTHILILYSGPYKEH